MSAPNSQLKFTAMMIVMILLGMKNGSMRKSKRKMNMKIITIQRDMMSMNMMNKIGKKMKRNL